MSARMGGTGLRTRAIAGVVLGIALLVGFVVSPSSPSAQGTGPPQGSLDALQEMNERILEAKAKNKGGSAGDVRELVRKAQMLKIGAIRDGFRGQTIHGCGAGVLIAGLELIDGDMSRAVAGKPEDEVFSLSGARLFARDTASFVDKCGDQRERVLAGQVRDLIEGVHSRAKKGDVSKGKLRKSAERVELLKGEMVAGEQVYDCDVMGFFTPIQSIDRALASAEVTEDRELRGSLIRKAAVDGGTLVDRWRELPCDPPPTGEFTVSLRPSWYHVNGFGSPPSRECNKVATEPDEGGAMVTDVITPPSGNPITKTAETFQDGEVVISIDIIETGTYKHETTVVSQDGVRATATTTHTVTSERFGPNGDCPAPTP